ncbi:MAG: MBOAT family protein [Fimbriiglobus sp.]
MDIENLPAWAVMWAVAAVIFVACKLLTLQGISAKLWVKACYFTLWPGLDAHAFCNTENKTRPTAQEWSFAVSKMTFGVILIFAVAPALEPELLRGWVGMVGIIFSMHFGAFHVLSCFWRRCGFVAKPLMNWPIRANSLADFWANRWNTAFRNFTHRFLFRPLAKYLGPKAGLVVGFLFSGVVHDLVISGPVLTGFGWPTLYFALQGVGLFAERRWPRIRSRAFTFAVVLLPAYGLFHPPFVRGVVVPFLNLLTSGISP